MTTFAKPYIAVVDDVTFAYVKMAEPAPTFDKSGTEYTVDAIVTEDQADDLKEKFPKIGCKEIKTVDFKEKYKIDPPYPNQKKQYVVKFKKKASKGDETFDPKFAPKVLLKQEDGSSLDITTNKLVANGSKGKLAFRAAENKFGWFAYLHSILVEELIEYVPSGGGNSAGSEFGVKVVGTAPTNPAVIADRKKAEAQGDVKRQATLAAQADEEDETVPF